MLVDFCYLLWSLGVSLHLFDGSICLNSLRQEVVGEKSMIGVELLWKIAR